MGHSSHTIVFLRQQLKLKHLLEWEENTMHELGMNGLKFWIRPHNEPI